MDNNTTIPGKDVPLELTIEKATHLLEKLNLALEFTNIINPTPACHSVHLRSRLSNSLYSNGKGTSFLAAKASALCEFVERLSTNYFFSDFFIEEKRLNLPFIYDPQERWVEDKKRDSRSECGYYD